MIEKKATKTPRHQDTQSYENEKVMFSDSWCLCVLVAKKKLLGVHSSLNPACPLTTKIKAYKGNVILTPDEKNGLTKKSEILTFHIRSISKERLIRKIGTIIKLQLDTVKLTLNDLLNY